MSCVKTKQVRGDEWEDRDHLKESACDLLQGPNLIFARITQGKS